MYTSHVLKDQEGRVVCPALYIYKYTIFVENIYIYIYKKTSWELHKFPIIVSVIVLYFQKCEISKLQEM